MTEVHQVCKNEDEIFFFLCAIIQIYGLKLLCTFKMLTFLKIDYLSQLPYNWKNGQICEILNSNSKTGSLQNIGDDLIFQTFEGTYLDYGNSAKARGEKYCF